MRASWKGQIQLWILMAVLMAGLTAAVQAPAAAQPAFRVADLNVDGPTDSFLASGQTSDVVEHQGDVYLAGYDGLYGIEPWRIDGTGGSPPEVMDICPGACSSQASDFTAVGSALFFVADDGAHGRELWVRDAGGTRLVADLVPGLDSRTPLHLAELGGKLVFNASGELWESDGTAAGTRLLANVSMTSESNPIPLGVAGSRLLFAADDGVHGKELWATDGTTAGTALVADICPGIAGSLGNATLVPDAPIAVVAGGRLFFSAFDCTHGEELWVSDGTPAGTHWVGSGGSAPAGLAALGSQVFFRASDDIHGLELWVSDGTTAGTHLVTDLRPGFLPGQPLEITAFGDRVYFHATDDPLGARRLWASDGTAAGTVLISAAAGFHEGLFHGLTVAGSRLIFFADDGIHGIEPWASDGTAAGTVPLGDFRPGADSFFLWGMFVDPDHRAAAGGRLYFRANDGVSGHEIWSTDGTADGTRMEGDLNTQTSSFAVQHGGGLGVVRPFGALAGEVLFPAGDGHSGLVPWKSDGSAAGTLALADPAPPSSTVSPQQFTDFGDLALFAGPGGPGGPTSSALWRTDGTPAGTFCPAETPDCPTGQPLSELTRLGDRVLFVQNAELQVTDGTADGTATLPAGSFPASLTPFPAAGKVLLRANGSGLGHELWASDGTVAGTQLIKDLRPGSGSSFPGALTAAGPQVFFFATDDAGEELWASDGTAAGTRRVTDIRPGANPGIPFSSNMVALGPVVLFAAGDAITGAELWRSDGTAAGTVLLRDIFPGQRSSEIRSLVAAGTRVFFVADNGVHGRELWTSDGTAAGTWLVEDILPGPGSSVPRELAVVDDLLLFAAHDGVHGAEPWASNGTAAGTFRIQDIAPGPLPSSPLAFHPAGPNVYFAATDADTGFELWALPRAGLSRFGDVPPSHWAWGFVEALAAAGITSGCGNGNFCPGAPVSRAQMAVFLGLAVHGAGFVPPPATGTLFSDVPAGAFAAAFIEQLAADGITSGCATAPLRFCPSVTVNRAQMAVFLLLAKHGAGFTPPAGTGAVFGDVGPDHWARDWIEQLAAEGITGGCGGGLFCPSRPLTRAEMAVFLTGALDLLP